LRIAPWEFHQTAILCFTCTQTDAFLSKEQQLAMVIAHKFRAAVQAEYLSNANLLSFQVTWMTRGHELVEALQAKIRNPSVMRLFSLSLQDFAEQCFVAAEAMPV